MSLGMLLLAVAALSLLAGAGGRFRPSCGACREGRSPADSSS